MKIAKIIIFSGLCFGINTAYSQAPVGGVLSEEAVNGIAASRMAFQSEAEPAYWTQTKMASAKPMPTPVVPISAAALAFRPIAQESLKLAEPGFSPSCPPSPQKCNHATRKLTAKKTLSAQRQAFGDLLQPVFGTEPINPKDGPYGPFQRWREAEPVTSYPKSAIGKLFFTLNGSDFVCSASVIGRSTLITAGHCNSDGEGHFATNRLFCPSYNGRANPERGCWSVVTSAITSQWHNTGDPDYDYSCLVTATTGTVKASKIGNITGILGRAWNMNPSQAVRTFGYPQAPPFTGATLQTTASTEWYTHDFTLGGQVSKIIGSDLTGGASGGPWIIGWTGGATETADTDGSQTTDPGTNSVNGVNSHKRCIVTCDSVPTTTSGLFWQEMTSPPFRNTPDDNAESEDVIAICLANANNNP